MTKHYDIALHLFRRDLRLEDNTALINALSLSKNVIPCFIFDERQIGNNAYKSNNAIQFMVNSLQEIDLALKKKQSKLFLFNGITEIVIEKIIAELKVQAIFINRDYTPYSRARDNAIKNLCEAKKIDFHCYADALLNEPEQILKSDQKPYTIFTHAYHKARQFPVSLPVKNNYSNYYQLDIACEDSEIINTLSTIVNPHILVRGGRKEGLTLLKNIKKLDNYSETRNFPALDGTTKLSAHNKFGTISIREFYQAIINDFGKSHILINELYWRDFFTHIAFHFPRVFEGAFHEKYNQIAWKNNEKYFQAWCEGKTGFPIVDAGMRELNKTGFMHNRVRMIVASFLTKDLHIDWRLGEKYFANKLVDYDPSVNNGNWQWAASTGCDAQPYFRIFNPWLQQKKFDPECVYIKKYVLELSHIHPSLLHQFSETPEHIPAQYIKPIVNHKIQSQEAKTMYK